MVVTGTAVSLIVISLLALLAVTIATLYLLPPILAPTEDDGQHH